MRLLKFDTSTRLSIAIAISLTFFLVEIAIGFRTRSIALIADAFHYLNDLIGFIVALAAILLSDEEDGTPHKHLTYGWQRASVLGAFFNGAFLLALGLSIFLQSIERFIKVEELQDPRLVVIVGAIGLGLNIVSMLLFHNHRQVEDHSHGHNHGHSHHSHAAGPLSTPSKVQCLAEEKDVGSSLSTSPRPSVDHHHQHRHTNPETSSINVKPYCDFGINGIVLHIMGDAMNNIGVIIAGLLVWKLESPSRFYADPAISLAIALMITLSALRLVKRTGHLLLQSPPTGLDVLDIQHDLESIPGISSVHDLRVWRLNQQKALATAHIVVEEDMSVGKFAEHVRTMNECLHAYGVHSATIQPEVRMRSGRPVTTLSVANVGSTTSTDTNHINKDQSES